MLVSLNHLGFPSSGPFGHKNKHQHSVKVWLWVVLVNASDVVLEKQVAQQPGADYANTAFYVVKKDNASAKQTLLFMIV